MPGRIYVGLHGWNGNPGTFDPLRPSVATDDKLFTPSIVTGESLEALVDELDHQIATLGTGFTLIGNCSGAILALLLSIRRPRQVRQLVLIDAFAFWPWYFRIFLSEPVGRYAYYTTFANPLGRWIANLSLASKRTADTTLTGGFENADHEANYRLLRQLRDAGSLDQFSGLRMPIELIYGQNTFQGVKVSAMMFQRLWPQARAYELAGAGHQPIREATPAMAEILFGKEDACIPPAISAS